MVYIVNNIRKNTLGKRNFQERQKMLKSFYHGCLEFPEQLDFAHYIGKYFFMKKMAFCRCVTFAFMMYKSPVFYVSSQEIPLTIITFYTAQKMKFSIKDSFSKFAVSSHLLKKSLMENFIFVCSVNHHEERCSS